MDSAHPSSDAAPTQATPSVERSAVTGVVFCGGRSRRMGRDKALLEVGGRSLLKRALECLQGISARQLLACGSDDRYSDVGIERVHDRAESLGPAAGLEAALADCRSEWLAVLACDMPRVRPEIFARLLERAQSLDLDFCLAATERGLEPLFGVYRRTCLHPLRECLDAGELKMVAFHGRKREDGRALKAGLLMLDGDCTDVANLNTPEDLELELRRNGEGNL